MHFLFWPAFIWHIFLEKKNSVDCLLKSKWLEKMCIFRGKPIFLSNRHKFSEVHWKTNVKFIFIFFIRHLVIAVSKRKIGHLTSDNHAIWMLDGVSIIPLARSDLHLRPVHIYLSMFLPRLYPDINQNLSRFYQILSKKIQIILSG